MEGEQEELGGADVAEIISDENDDDDIRVSNTSSFSQRVAYHMLQNQNGTKKLSEKLCSENRKTVKCALQDNPKKSKISVVSGDQGRNTQGSSPLWEKEDQLAELQSSIPRHCNGRRWGWFLWLCRGDKK